MSRSERQIGFFGGTITLLRRQPVLSRKKGVEDSEDRMLRMMQNYNILLLQMNNKQRTAGTVAGQQ